MLELFRNELEAIDREISLDNPGAFPRLFSRIPLDLFGAIQVDRPNGLSHLMSILPQMPTAEVQNHWTGAADHVLLGQSVNFIRTVVSHYHQITRRPIEDGTVLDFGCGWGRLTRLLYKYVPFDRIWGIDPMDRSLAVCRDTNMLNPLAESAYLPTSLPVGDTRFDLIIAFSVYTHLSEKATRVTAAVLRDYLKPDGVLALTIRPAEYWQHHDFKAHGLDPKERRPRLQDRHARDGFAFEPHKIKPVDGDITYGDTSIALEWIEKNLTGLSVRGVDWNKSDPFQIVVFLGRSA